MKKFIVMLIVYFILGIPFGFLDQQSKAAPEAPTIVSMKTKMGTVTFDHIIHSNKNECIVCHHSGVNVSCKTCHGVNSEILKVKKAFHKQCKACHKDQEVGPVKCKECHIK
jgi:hypothetical protein